MRGLRKYLTPFAPDQSGAVSVLYEFGGISLSVMPADVPEISVDLMSRDGLRAKVHCSVRGFVTWMRSLDVMTAW